MVFAAARDGRAVIFDLDGTLVDTGADIAAAVNVAREALGLAPMAAPAVISCVGDGVQRLLERVLAHDPLTGRSDGSVPAAVVQAGLSHFAAHYERHLLDHTALYPGIVDLLAALSDRPLYVATNKPRRFTLRIMDGLGIARLFRRIVAGDDVPSRKPDPAHLAACLAGTALQPADVVVVGDSRNDVQAARGLGCRVVGVTWGLEPVDRLIAAAPDALVDDVQALVRELGVAR